MSEHANTSQANLTPSPGPEIASGLLDVLIRGLETVKQQRALRQTSQAPDGAQERFCLLAYVSHQTDTMFCPLAYWKAD